MTSAATCSGKIATSTPWAPAAAAASGEAPGLAGRAVRYGWYFRSMAFTASKAARCIIARVRVWTKGACLFASAVCTARSVQSVSTSARARLHRSSTDAQHTRAFTMVVLPGVLRSTSGPEVNELPASVDLNPTISFFKASASAGQVVAPHWPGLGVDPIAAQSVRVLHPTDGHRGRVKLCITTPRRWPGG